MANTSLAETSKQNGQETASDAFQTDDSAMSQRLIRSILIFTVAGVALYGAATLASDYRSVAASLLSFPLITLFQVLLLVIVGWLIRGWRFYYYLGKLGYPVPLGYSIAAFLAGFALTGTPGKLGEAVKAVFLKKDYAVSGTRVVGIVMMERLMDLWGVLLLGSLSLMLFTEWRGVFLICAVALIAGGGCLCMEKVYSPLLDRLGRVPFLAWPCSKILGILTAARDLMTPRIFFVGLLASAVAWGMESFSLYLILDGLGLPSTVLQANFAYCFSTLIGALSMLPGGIGGAEASMVGVLKLMGISYAEGLPAVILIRVCTLWLAVAVGIGFMSVMLSRIRR
jgi:glycosyltransferase 2 family protein